MYSCKRYLDKTIKADIQGDQIFTNFVTFEGFVEKLYCNVPDFGRPSYGNVNPEWNWGDDVIGTFATFRNGDLWSIQNPYIGGGEQACTNTSTTNKSIWNNGWVGIRGANIAIAHLGNLIDATAEEKNVIKGQAYFWRGYFHFQIMKQWGSIPYLDTVFSPADEMKVPVLNLYVTGEKALADLQTAVDLLPVDWDATVVGQPTEGNNRGRLTKGIALSFLAEAQLWLGSPLMNGVATGSYTYNTDYCKKAAASAWKVIELANQGVYALEPWATYKDIFARRDATEPRSKETIFKCPFYGEVNTFKSGRFRLSVVGGEGNYVSPTENYVELFETASGLPIDDPQSGFNPMNPWTNRDPRFSFNILVDQDRICLSRNDNVAFAQFYTGGRDRGAGQSQAGFGVKKFVYTEWNNYDNQYSTGFFVIPIMRLAEIYLFYAEAANEAYGPLGKDPNANLTAVDAVNIVRARANMPEVNAKFTGSTEAFRERVRNERAVELCFEGKRRDDLRRWHIATDPQYKDLYSCEFPQDHSSFSKQIIASIVFQEKHYWLPFPTNQVLLYPEWKQNPGW